MEVITAYRFRGQIFDSKDKALKHIDELIGSILTRHAHRLAQIDKYKATLEYLEENAADFYEIHLLQEDKRIVED